MESAYDTLTRALTGRLEVPAELVHPDAAFGELGLDSLAVVEFEFIVSDSFGVELWPDGFDPDMRICDAVRALSGAI